MRRLELPQSDRVAPPGQRYLVLLRHGESAWNRENRFTGWTDVDLSPAGNAESHASARLLQRGRPRLRRRVHLGPQAGDPHAVDRGRRPRPDVGAGSPQLAAERAPLRRTSGAQQGRDRAALRRGTGPCLAAELRVRPPPLEPGDPRWERDDPRYAALGDAELPRSESLADTIARVLPYWETAIAPALRADQRVLVVAHGNSLRGLVMHLDRLGEEEITALTIPTGIPLVYRLTAELRPIDHRYLGGGRGGRVGGGPRGGGGGGQEGVGVRVEGEGFF